MKCDDNIDSVDYLDSSLNDTTSFVYRFIDIDDNIIYVGRTKNLKERIKIHFSKQGHLPKKCLELVDRIEYIQFKTNLEASIRELYYINKYKPRFNQKDKYESEECTIQLPNKEWMVYRYASHELIQELEAKNKEQYDEIKLLREKLDYILIDKEREISELKQIIEEKSECIDLLNDKLMKRSNLENQKNTFIKNKNVTINFYDAVNLIKKSQYRNFKLHCEWYCNGNLDVNYIIYKDCDNEVYIYNARNQEHIRADSINKYDPITSFSYYYKGHIDLKSVYNFAFKKYKTIDIINNINKFKNYSFYSEGYHLTIDNNKIIFQVRDFIKFINSKMSICNLKLIYFEDNSNDIKEITINDINELLFYKDKLIRVLSKEFDIKSKNEVEKLLSELKDFTWYDSNYRYLREQIEK